MKIAAVVVTYNRLNLLKECINAIRNQTHKVDEIIVINNSSTDGTLEWLEEQKDLTVITQENLGGAGGFYTGIKTAYEKGYDWIWCMDDDAKPLKNSLQIKVEFLEKNNSQEQISAVTATVKHLFDGSIDFTHRRILKKSKIFPYIFEDLEFNSYSNETTEIDIASFVGILINSNVVREIGYPIKDYFIFFDDVEYSIRLRKQGKIINCNKSIFVHGASNPNVLNSPYFSDKIRFKNFLIGMRNLLDILKKYYSHKYLLKFQIYIKITHFIIIGLEYKDKLERINIIQKFILKKL